jgi:hypothetical protein
MTPEEAGERLRAAILATEITVVHTFKSDYNRLAGRIEVSDGCG